MIDAFPAMTLRKKKKKQTVCCGKRSPKRCTATSRGWTARKKKKKKITACKAVTSTHLTCVSCQRRRRDDGFVLAEVRALPHIVFESALGLVAVQGGGVVLRVEAVVRGYPLQAAEGGLAAPRLGQPVAALEALDALEGVLAAKLTCEQRMKG